MQQLNQNHFQLFDLAESFALDIDALSEKYRELQVEMHPDRFANAGEAEKLRAVQFSSLLNEAYATLKSPTKRAGYLLQLQGLDVDKVSQEDLGMDLLMEQMQLREELEELPKDESALEKLEELKRQVARKIDQRQSSFAKDLLAGELLAAKRSYHEMQFLNKLAQEIDQGEEQRLGY